MKKRLPSPLGGLVFAGEQFGMAWNPAHADDLLAGAGHTLDEIVAATGHEKRSQALSGFQSGSRGARASALPLGFCPAFSANRSRRGTRKCYFLTSPRKERNCQRWQSERCHSVSADVNQPVDKKAAGEYGQIVARLIERIANADAKPTWKRTSFFHRDAKN